MTVSSEKPSAPIIEIAGVAGSGKSTLASTLCGTRNLGVLDDTLRMRDPRHVLLAAHSLPRLAGLFTGWIAGPGRPTWTELKLVIYLQEWRRYVSRRSRPASKILVMDQGPVYALARLGCLEPQITGTEPHGRWWASTSEAWSKRIDAVLWLDAPNDVLLQRVNARAQAHQIKGQSDRVGLDFLDRYRASYDSVLAAFEGASGPRLLRYDTSSMSADEIASDAIERLADLLPLQANIEGEVS